MTKCQYVNLGKEHMVFTILFFELFKRLKKIVEQRQNAQASQRGKNKTNKNKFY